MTQSNAAPGLFTFVLHTHLPWLAHHGRWPVGEEWLYQSWSAAYLPLMRVLRTLADEDVTGSRRQFDAALTKEPTLHPFATAVFGGVFDPAQHRFPFNRMPASDVRDWAAIRAWANEVARRFTAVEAAA